MTGRIDPEIERLFHELVDLSPAERDARLSAEPVSPAIRAEVDALLRFDAADDLSVTESIAERCGPYRILRLLGHGGMGFVYLAERTDGEVEQRVAIKLLRHGTPVFRDRFLRERQILATLSHPGIAGLLDAGHTETGQPYLVMDYIDGTPIDRYAEPLDVEDTLELFIAVCEAISYAHRNLVVHRDIKPSNILVSAAGEPKLLDFGIAKLLDEGSEPGPATLTREGGGALTPEYAAPEQVTGGVVTTATDVYSLGVLLYVLLTGQHPAGPGTHSPAALIKATVEIVPSRVSDAVTRSKNPRRAVRGDLDTIVATALKKDPQERYFSVAALAEDLRRYLKHQPISARPDTVAYRCAMFVRRNRIAVALAGFAMIASVAGVAGTVTQARTARAQRDFALRQLTRAEAINDLNSFVLSDAAPLGKPFTVNDLLARAEAIIDRQRGNPTSRVELLISIGRQYQIQDERATARRVIEHAYTLSRGLKDASTRARASCALGSALARGEQSTRAEPLIRDGLREISGDSINALDRIFCLLRGSEVSRQLGATREAIGQAQEAQRLLENSPFQSELQDLTVSMAVAESFRTAGALVLAAAAFERASQRLSALGRDETQTAGTLFNNWALTLSLLGRPSDAERIYRRAIDVSRADQTENAVSPMLLVNFASALQELGRTTEAADYVERAYIQAQRAGDETVMSQSLLRRAEIDRSRGDVNHAADALSELETRWRRIYPAGHIAFASLASQHSLNAQARGELQPALDLANQGVTIAEQSIKRGGSGSDFLPVLLVRKSEIELQLQRPTDAIADARRALDMLQRPDEARVLNVRAGRAWLALGRALRTDDKRDDARAAMRSALEHFQDALGPDHRDTRIARQLMQDLEAQ
jgi:serine/threonine-protein kinase